MEEKVFTKDQVSNLMKRRVERSHQAFFDRYGVKNLQELDDLFALAKMCKDEEPEKDPMLNFNKIIGLEDVKTDLYKAVAILEKQRNGNEKYFSSICFSGESGTGKTIASVIFANMLYEKKLIKRKKPHIVCGDTLCEKDLPELYSDNKYGLIVIECAASMFESCFGGERISFIYKLGEMMDKYKNSVITVFSDTPAKISRMLKGNIQISNRVSMSIQFEPYSFDELNEIAETSIRKSGYIIHDDAKEELQKLIKYLKRQPNFAYARTLRNTLEKIFVIQANRTVGNERDVDITLEDILMFEKSERISRVVLKDADKKYEKQLNELIGLKKAKTQIIRIKSYALKNIKNPDNLNLHMCFTGNPGTGKTEVAKLLAGILYENGILPENKLVQKDRSELVAEYIGQTAPLVRRAVSEALGGVLFIDEAYMLDPRDCEKDFGYEALAELLKCMEDYRGQFAVIFAGYKNETLDMLERNPGLKSRVNRYIDFPNYTKRELTDIACLMVKNSGYDCGNKVIERVVEIAETKRENDNFANAREVRNILESLYEIQSVRTVSNNNRTITVKDVAAYIKENDIKLSKDASIKIEENVDYIKSLKTNPITTTIDSNYVEDRTVLIECLRDGKLAGEGTGFIISPNGLIVTNHHVIDKADEIKVRKTLYLQSGEKVNKEYKVSLVKKDALHDAALLIVQEKDHTFPYFLLAENYPEVLSPVMMGGYPFGASRLNNISFNEGTIQSINKDSKLKDEQDTVDRIYVDINGVPGNSGSALVDKATGEVLGIYSGGSVHWQNGAAHMKKYAMPIKYVWDLLPKASHKTVNQ